jgi:hypothetical protein
VTVGMAEINSFTIEGLWFANLDIAVVLLDSTKSGTG